MESLSELKDHEHDYEFINMKTLKKCYDIKEVEKDLKFIEPIDKNVVNLVKKFRTYGFETLFSCEGGIGYTVDDERTITSVFFDSPYITFTVENIETVHKFVDYVCNSDTLSIDIEYWRGEWKVGYKVKLTMSDMFIDENYDNVFDSLGKNYDEINFDSALDKDIELRFKCIAEMEDILNNFPSDHIFK